MSSKNKLLITIAALVLVIGVIVFLIFRNPADNNQSLTKEQLSRYEEGNYYRTTVTSTVNGRVEAKDWGGVAEVSFVHLGEIDFIRKVSSVNADHSEVIVELEILKARDLETELSLDNANLDLPPAVGLLTKAASKFLYKSPSGMVAKVAADRALKWLRSEKHNEKTLSAVNFAVKAASGRGIEEHLLSAKLSPLDAYEGLTAEYSYEAGVGVTCIPTRGILSKEQENRVKEFSVYSEAYLLPDPDQEGDQEWEVDVTKIAHLLAPSQDLEVTGTLTLKRGKTDGGVTRLKIVKGKVVFSGDNDSAQVLGTWAARGSLFYDLNTHTIIEGNLTGEVSLEKRSSDHILFEKKFKSAPSYRVVISGFATRDETEARKEVIEKAVTR